MPLASVEERQANQSCVYVRDRRELRRMFGILCTLHQATCSGSAAPPYRQEHTCALLPVADPLGLNMLPEQRCEHLSHCQLTHSGCARQLIHHGQKYLSRDCSLHLKPAKSSFRVPRVARSTSPSTRRLNRQITAKRKPFSISSAAGATLPR